MKPSFGRRLSLLFGGILTLLIVSLVIASVTANKPYGVKDVQREQYEKMLEQIVNRQTRIEAPRSIAVVESESPLDTFTQPNETLAFQFALRNEGQLPLSLNPIQVDYPSDVTLSNFPLEILPGAVHQVMLDWTVPNNSQGETSEKVLLETNDPLKPTLALEFGAIIATPLEFTSEIVCKPAEPGQDAMGVSYLFSQQYSQFDVLQMDASTHVRIEIEPCNDLEILKRYRAKSAIKITAYYPPQDRTKKFDIPIRFAIDTSSKESWVTTRFRGSFMPAVAFYGPEIHGKEGLDFGAIDIHSDSSWSFIARFRGNSVPAQAIVKEVQPPELEATIESIKSNPSDYRVTLRVKPDAKPVNFQTTKQGYVLISSAENPSISNWLPLHGVLVDITRSE